MSKSAKTSKFLSLENFQLYGMPFEDVIALSFSYDFSNILILVLVKIYILF